MVPLLYPLGNPRTKSPWPEDSRGFSEGLLSGYIVSVYYMPIPKGHIWSIVSVLTSLIRSIDRPSGFLYKANKYMCSKALVPLR